MKLQQFASIIKPIPDIFRADWIMSLNGLNFYNVQLTIKAFLSLIKA